MSELWLSASHEAHLENMSSNMDCKIFDQVPPSFTKIIVIKTVLHVWAMFVVLLVEKVSLGNSILSLLVEQAIVRDIFKEQEITRNSSTDTEILKY